MFCVGLAGGLLGLGASHSDDKEGSDKEALDKIRDGPNDLRQGCRGARSLQVIFIIYLDGLSRI